MYKIWGDSGAARVRISSSSSFYSIHSKIYDFGACTVPQLLFGYDENLNARVQEENRKNNYKNNNNNQDDTENDDDDDDDDYVPYDDDDNLDRVYSDDFTTYFDGTNPCLMDPNYLDFLNQQYLDKASGSSTAIDGESSSSSFSLKYDYIILNDNTRSPARYNSRKESLTVLESTYIPWFLETKAIPVFLCTYGYWSPYRDMGGLEDVPTFTSFTYQGYREYVHLVRSHLPESQAPLLAPVGLVFLMIWEENYNLWEQLFHVDKVHPSPLGTYVQGMVVYYTLYQRLPPPTQIQQDSANLFLNVRRFQPGQHRRSPFPSQTQIAYLIDIVLRVCRYGHLPKSLLLDPGEPTSYIPEDDQFAVDDLF
jgi:hypothetical protein